MRTTTVTFEKVTYKAKKRLTCRNCGKRILRQQTFWQTISPFNKTLLGVPKTYTEIMASLKEEASYWEPEDICQNCEG
jgi:hypothetical protein